MNDFNGNFAKAFPERTARNIAEVARQKVVRKSLDPFGAFGDALAEESELEKSRVKIGSKIRYKGKRGRVTRYCSPTDAAHDSPTYVHIVLDGDTTSVGLDVLLADVVPDDADHMDLPGSIHVASEARGEQSVTRAWNPMPVDDEPAALSKLDHLFEEGHRVVVNKPGHAAHGLPGKITVASGDHFFVRLDSGHEVRAYKTELTPEDFPDPVTTIANALKRGEDITIPSRLKKVCEQHPVLQKLISAGRIRFQETMFY